jgi:hypothetical protein
MAKRSLAMMESMSPPWVDNRSAPRTVRWRWIGTATETMVSPAALTRTMLPMVPESARATSGRLLPLLELMSSTPGRPERPRRRLIRFQVRCISGGSSLLTGGRSKRMTSPRE